MNRFIKGKTLNRMIELRPDDKTLDGWQEGWCSKYTTTIERRKIAAATALKRHWEKGGQVLEWGFGRAWKQRQPGIFPDSLRGPDDLAELLVNRCQGFNLELQLVSLGPFPCSGND